MEIIAVVLVAAVVGFSSSFCFWSVAADVAAPATTADADAAQITVAAEQHIGNSGIRTEDGIHRPLFLCLLLF